MDAGGAEPAEEEADEDEVLKGGHGVVGDEFVVPWVAQGCGCSHVQEAETGLLVLAVNAFVAADIKGPLIRECSAMRFRPMAGQIVRVPRPPGPSWRPRRPRRSAPVQSSPAAFWIAGCRSVRVRADGAPGNGRQVTFWYGASIEGPTVSTMRSAICPRPSFILMSPGRRSAASWAPSPRRPG